MKKLVIVTFVTFLLIPFILAGNDLTYPANKEIDLKISCFNNGSYCSGSAICNLTIQYPNGSIFLNNQQMTNNGAFHNYTLIDSITGNYGKYHASMVCDDSGTFGYSVFDFSITSDGTEQTTGKSIIFGIMLFVSLILSILFLIYGLKEDKPIPIFVGVVLSVLFLIVTYQTMMLIPEIQMQLNLYDSVLTIYEILLYAFFVIFIFFIIYIIYKALILIENPQKAKMKKWGLLMEDE